MASDVTITLDSITAPLILFSGSNKLEIKDSNRNNPGVYKPAGGQYDDKQMLVYTTPGENHDEVKNELAKAPVKTNFGTQYSIATSDTAKSDPQGNVVVDKYINSDCVECNNISNPNPVKTNESSIRLMNYHFTTPDKVDNNENSNTVAVTGECTPYRDLSLLSLIRPTVCSNPINVLLGTLGSLFPSHDWNQCNPEKDTGCVSSEDLVVKMNPIFKETNEYMGARNASAMNPQAAKSYVPIYVLTSCIARITAKSGASIDVGVKCVWDMSYLFYENGASAYDNSPTLDDTMSDDQYIKYLQGETVSRGSESLTSM
jgi:hypothetical protein